MTIDDLRPAPLPAESQKSPFQRIAGVLFAPAETFQDIARKPDVLGVLILLVVLAFISTWLTMSRLDYDALFAQQADEMRARGTNMSEQDMERVQKFTVAITKAVSWVSPALMVAWYAIVAAVLLLAFRLFGGEGTFRQAFSATVYSWLPLTLFSIISTIVVVARGTFDPTTAATIVKSNPAFLVDMKEQPILFSLFSSFDVFTIWTIVLLVFGFAALSKSSKAKSAAIVVSLWFVMIVVKLGFAALGAARMKG